MRTARIGTVIAKAIRTVPMLHTLTHDHKFLIAPAGLGGGMPAVAASVDTIEFNHLSQVPSC
jgi:hypothetical protein